MSWASRRRVIYVLGGILVLAALIAVPIVAYFAKPATCTDSIQNQGETAIDKGGPCPLLDERTLSPSSVLWSRSFRVRDGSYNTVAYIQNSNESAGISSASYHLGLYDDRNILVAERTGATFIMPGSITPVFEPNINTGNRIVTHTYFEFTAPLVWERMRNTAKVVNISNREVSGVDAQPRIEAIAENTSVAPIKEMSFIAVIFSPKGNASAASATSLSRLSPGEKQQIVFTWPDKLDVAVGRVDILPRVLPVTAPAPQ